MHIGYLNYYYIMKILLYLSLLTAPIMTTNSQSQVNFKPKDLSYEYCALEPHISEETMTYHHGRHYVGYIAKLNEMVPGTPFEGMTIAEIVCGSDGALFNNAAQALNHEFYFDALSANPQKMPTGALLESINRDFGSVDLLIEQMNKVAATLFGSGWAWLAADKDGKLSIVAESNAGTPLCSGLKPLMCIDVWEHAYYIDHRNRRPDAIKAFWNVLDWKVVDGRY